MKFSVKDFEVILDRTPTSSIKWDPDYMIERFGTSDLIPFNHAEMDFQCPAPIIEAVQSRAKHGIYGYTLVKPEYYDAVIQWYKSRHQLQFAREEILYTTGVIFSLRNVVSFFTKPGDEIMIFTPIYKPLADAVLDNSRKLIMVALKLQETQYVMDFDAINHILETHSIKLCIICNPHNPTGRVWTQTELRKLGDFCLAHHVLIVSDEIHCDLIGENHQYGSIAGVSVEIGANCIVLSSMTKTFNTSGLKIANIFIKNPDLRQPFFNYYDKKFIYAPNVFGIIGMQTAYTKCAPWVDILTHYLDENYRFVQEFISSNNLDITLIRREGTPVIWLDFRRIPLPADRIFKFLVEKARIIPYDGRDFVANGEGFQRLSVGYPRPLLKEGLIRIKQALDQL